MDDMLETTETTTVAEFDGLELQPGDVAEIRVEADGSSSARIIAHAGTPEAEAWHSANAGPADLEVNPA